MGNSRSTTHNARPRVDMNKFKEHYTESEINNRIDQLFKKQLSVERGVRIDSSVTETLNMNNIRDELEQSKPLLEIDDREVDSVQRYIAKGGSRFISKRNRYKKYTLPTLTELQKQSGGAYEEDYEDDEEYNKLTPDIVNYNELRSALIQQKRQSGGKTFKRIED